MEVKRIYFKNRHQLRDWLKENYDKEKSIWLVHDKFKKGELSYDDIVEEALCFGWIDSTVKSMDEKHSTIYLSVRKPKSIWAKSNKERVERLIRNGLMTKAGFEVIERAKSDGSWTEFDVVENLVIPPELEEAFAKNKLARENFENLTLSQRKQVLYFLYSTKQEVTRRKRIEKILPSLKKGENPFLS